MESLIKKYRCVNCGVPAKDLIKMVGPSEFKLSKCENCKGAVDKFIVCNPVIITTGVMLLSREAMRHVLYNSKIKSYLMPYIVFLMLEGYAAWRNASPFSMAVNFMCDLQNYLILNFTFFRNIAVNMVPKFWMNKCQAWGQEMEAADNDLLIRENDFLVLFLSAFAEVAGLLLAIYSLIKAAKVCGLLKPMKVLYNSPVLTISIVWILTNCATSVTSFLVTPYLRGIIA